MSKAHLSSFVGSWFLASLVTSPVVAMENRPGLAIAPLDCVINPSVVADLGSGVPGILSQISVDRSDPVKAGDVVAELESGVENAALDLARARAGLTAEVDLREVNAAFGQRQNKRTKDLFQRKAISTNDMDQRQTEARIARIQLRQALDNQDLAQLEMLRAQEILKRRSITSPISGVVMERFKVIGEYVEDQPVVRVAQIDPLHVEVIVPIEQMGMVRDGMSAEVWSEVVEGKKWHATVDRVDRVADVASGTYGVRLILPNPEHHIPAGLRCRVQLVDKPAVSDMEKTTAVSAEKSAKPLPESVQPARDIVSNDLGASQYTADALAVRSEQATPKVLEQPAVQKVAKPTPVEITAVQGSVIADSATIEKTTDDAEVSAKTPGVETETVKTAEDSTTAESIEKEPLSESSPSVVAADEKDRLDLEPAKTLATPVGITDVQRPVTADSAKVEKKTDVAEVAVSVETPGLEAKAVKPAEDSATADPIVKEALPESSPTAVAANEKDSLDVASAQALPECRLVGPFNDEAKATEKFVTLRGAGLFVDMRSVPPKSSPGFMVATPILPSRAVANALVEKLEATGFTDYYVPKKRSSPMRVSLGLYKNERSAKRLARKLEAKGFATELLPWTRKGSEFVLVIRGTPSDANEKLLAALPVPAGSAGATQGFCNQLAGR